jgi:hypothetical protein
MAVAMQSVMPETVPKSWKVNLGGVCAQTQRGINHEKIERRRIVSSDSTCPVRPRQRLRHTGARRQNSRHSR